MKPSGTPSDIFCLTNTKIITMTNSSSQDTPHPIPNVPAASTGRFTFEPMPGGDSPFVIIDALLKHPGRVLYELQKNWRIVPAAWLLLFALGGLALYGIVVGSFTGGSQIWIAPAKLVMGGLLSMLICLPSLYIFTCLSGTETHLRTIASVLFAAVALVGFLLVGFAPVAWIFSQATDSIGFMGGLHLLLWAISMLFGLRLIRGLGWIAGGAARIPLKTWGCVFMLVCLQMMTTLRPIIGKSGQFLPREKKFFLAHWMETINGGAPADTSQD